MCLGKRMSQRLWQLLVHYLSPLKVRANVKDFQFRPNDLISITPRVLWYNLMIENVEAVVLSEIRKHDVKKPDDEELSASSLQELGIDSLSVLEIVMSIEDYYRIEIDESKFADCQTVNNVITLVRNTIEGRRCG